MSDTDRISAFIDIPFYAEEAGIAFSSARQATAHFLGVGQQQDLSPSPLILWGAIRAENPDVSDFQHFVADPFRACTHPAFALASYFDLCRAADGNLAVVMAMLSRTEIDRGPLLPQFVDAARAMGYLELLPFMASLSATRTSDARLEMEVFSSSWYLDAYDDVKRAGMNPFRHYVVSGWKERRDPSPTFSTALYLDHHSDVVKSGVNPLIHFLRFGEREDRSIHHSTAYFPLIRHRAKRGKLPAQYVPFKGDDDEAIQDLCSEIAGAQVVIVVPFYQNEGLVEPVCSSLRDCADELKALKTNVILVNDSPDYAALKHVLHIWASELSAEGLDVILFENLRNYGFIHSSNIGLRCAALLSCPCLMLNSDTVLQRGSLSEMLHVASLDDRFAFVNPLSNNATIATFGLEVTSDAASATRHHAAVAEALPRYLIVPTCVGFCLLVRPEIIRLFGYLDPAYGQGYNEENDYIMRANRKGYLSVLAPRAFVSHVGEQSFSSLNKSKTAREDRNRRILLDRYPEFETAVDNYFASPEAQARRVVERYGRSVDFLIDASALPNIANGTSVLARELTSRLIRRLGVERCAVRASTEQLQWLGLVDFPGLKHWDLHDLRYAKISMRLSQPFTRAEVERMSSYSTKLVFFMLDTISDDCLYLQKSTVHDLWEWLSEFSDALIFNSPYSMNKYQRRFDVASHVVQRASYHSFDVDDYSNKYKPVDDVDNLLVATFILVIGNYYQHKVIDMALDALDCMDIKIVLLGAKSARANVISFEAGRLTQDEVAFLYKKAAVILFPSLYEGFGFPIMEGLASGNPIIVYNNELTRDMVFRLGAPATILMFESFFELREKVSLALSSNRAPSVEQKGVRDGWDRSVDEIVEVLGVVYERDFSYTHVAKRLKSLKRLL